MRYGVSVRSGIPRKPLLLCLFMATALRAGYPDIHGSYFVSARIDADRECPGRVQCLCRHIEVGAARDG